MVELDCHGCGIYGAGCKGCNDFSKWYPRFCLVVTDERRGLGPTGGSIMD